MPIQTEWQLDFNPQDLLAGQPASLSTLLTRPAIRADWELALEETRRLIRPIAIWETIPVREFRHERMVVGEGVILTGGPITQVMAGAENLIVGVCTVGEPISQAAASAKQEGAMMRSMFLDLLGAYAVGQLRQQLVVRFEGEARAQGLHISTMLSPGESEWPVSQQTALFSLVDAGQIGVRLTATLMMAPMKSLSLVVGTGMNPLGSEGGVNCDFCVMRETCPHSQSTLAAAHA